MLLPRALRVTSTSFRICVLAYYARTKCKPERVLYYRNGVSEGQQFDVLQAEMRALVKAFKMISEHYRPPVTFVVANKRHHLRAFPVESRDADHMGNAVPGTVIDAGVVDPHRFDFYLYGHGVIPLGTKVPCHYTVLHDENNLSADDITRLAYHLGYTVSRSSHSVAVVAPLQYARLARLFLKEGSAVEGDASDSANSPQFELAEVHGNVKNAMFTSRWSG